jgi:uncharacterized OB-fold protein
MYPPSYHRIQGPYLRLEGQRCSGCGKYQFPPRTNCRHCHGADVLTHSFSGKGTVTSYSELAQPADGFDGPLIIALVTLDEGVTVSTQLTDVDADNVQIGMSVEMVTRRLRELGPEGCLIYGYKFRPIVE